MASIHWAHGVSGTWTTAADWAGGVVPGRKDKAVIKAAGRRYTVSVTTPVSIGALILESRNATLSVDSTFTASSMMLESGTMLLDNGTLAGTLSVAGGTLTLASGTDDTLRNVTLEGSFIYASDPNSTLTITGALTLTGAGGTGPGFAAFENNVVLDGVSTLDNATVFGGAFDVVNTPTLTLGSGLSTDGFTLTLNSAEALINDGLLTSAMIIGGTLTNNGTIAGGGSIAAASFTNNGQIDVSDAALYLDIGGLNAPGAAGVINVGDGGSVVFVGSETTAQLIKLFAQQRVSTSGSLFGTGIVGTLNNAGATLTVGTGSVFGTFTTYYNTRGGSSVITGGTVVDNGGNGALSGILSSLALQSQTDTLSLGINTQLDDVTVTGATVVTASSLALNGGTLSGVGTVSEILAYSQISGLTLNGVDITGVNGSGAVTIDVTDRTGLTITAAQSIAGYNIQLTGDYTGLNVLGGAVLNDATAIFADAGGTDFLSYGSIGESTSVTLGANFVTTITSGTNLVFDTSDTENTLISSMGTFDVAGTLQLGYSNTFDIEIDNTGTIDVSSGGTLSVVQDDNGLTTMTNAGTITANAGVIDIATAITNSGLISDAFGGSAITATIQGAITGAGIIALAGAGTLALGGTVAAGQVVQFGTGAETLDLTNSAASMGFSGTLDGFAEGDAVVLSGENISSARFSGASIIATISTGGSIVLATGARLHGSVSVSENGGNATLTYASGEPSLQDWSAGTAFENGSHAALAPHEFGGLLPRWDTLALDMILAHHPPH